MRPREGAAHQGERVLQRLRQHHAADLGFLGVSRNVNGRRVPHFQVVVGGQWSHNAGAYGLAIGAIPSKNVPEMVKRLSDRFTAERRGEETASRPSSSASGRRRSGPWSRSWRSSRPTKQTEATTPISEIPASTRSATSGVGECAGEVVPLSFEMALAAAEREVFEAQVLLEQGDVEAAAGRAYRAMLTAARALAREREPNIGDDADEIVRTFQREVVDTKLFLDPFAGAKFAHYLTKAHREGGGADSAEGAHQRIEEAQLFVDASHQCHERMVKAAQPSELARAAE
jgi:sulfite reductase (ferredoxin)